MDSSSMAAQFNFFCCFMTMRGLLAETGADHYYSQVETETINSLASREWHRISRAVSKLIAEKRKNLTMTPVFFWNTVRKNNGMATLGERTQTMPLKESVCEKTKFSRIAIRVF